MPASPRAGRVAGGGLTLLALLAIGWATLRPGDPAVMEPHGHWCLVCGSVGGADVVANVILFLPFGAGLALLGVSGRVALLAALATTLSVELAQAFVLVGRAATLSDIVTNTSGALLAHGVLRRWRLLLDPPPRVAAVLVGGWLALLAVGAALGHWLLQPDLRPGGYHLQEIPPGSIASRPFEGTVLEARVNGIAVSPGFEPAGGPVDRALAAAAPRLEAVVIPQSYAPGMLRPIVSVHDASWRGQVVLGQRREHLVYAYHANARRARLRTPAVQLRGAFPATGTRGPATRAPISLTAEQRDRSISLTSESSFGKGGLTMALSPLHIWTTILPIPLSDRPLARLLTLLHATVWLVPLGFWSMALARQSRRMGVSAVIVTFVVVGAVISSTGSLQARALLGALVLLATGGAVVPAASGFVRTVANRAITAASPAQGEERVVRALH